MDAEKIEMKDFLGENAELIFLADGTAAWWIHYCPEFLDQSKCHNEKCEREYDIAIVYEDDYPNTPEKWLNVKVYGTKAFFLKPTIGDLSRIATKLSLITASCHIY